MTQELELEAVGRGITEAAVFMKNVFSEVALLYRDVERQFQKLGLFPLDAKYVYLNASANLDSPNAWIQESSGRIFSKGGAKPASELVVVEVHLDPGHGLREPIVVVAVASWGVERSKSEATRSYGKNDWAWSVAPDPAQLGKWVEVDANPDVLPGARSLHLFAGYLTRLTNSAEVERTLGAEVGSFLGGNK